ncbi:MAG: hypothetical protein OEM38_01185 [Gammaproteobacteria bacterium]|nr:hypothetical protein [Gammaproteobacteria bacterium]
MKKRHLTFFTIGSALMIAGGSYAVDESITITATIPAWALIEPSTTAARITLDGRPGAPDYNESLLTLSLSHNSAIGYNIEIKSANDGKLVGASDGTKNIPYMISYDSKAPVVLTHTPQNVGGATTSVTGIAITPFLKNVDIIISNEDANAATQQDYEDTVTFTLTGI